MVVNPGDGRRRKISAFQSKLGPLSTGLSLDPSESLLLKRELQFRQLFGCPEAKETFQPERRGSYRLLAVRPAPPLEQCPEEDEAGLVHSVSGVSLDSPSASPQRGATSVGPIPRMCRTDRPVVERGAARRCSSGHLVGQAGRPMLDQVASRSFSAPDIPCVDLTEAWANVPNNAPVNPFAVAAAPPKRPAQSVSLVTPPGQADSYANPFAELAGTPFAAPFGRFS